MPQKATLLIQSALIVSLIVTPFCASTAIQNSLETSASNSPGTLDASIQEDLIVRVLWDPKPDPQNNLGLSKRETINNSRFVFAHIVQGNFQVYEEQDWVEDITLAKKSGIDAFAINIGRDASNDNQLPLIYNVAERNAFSVFLSFDMNYYGQADSSKDVSLLIQNYGKRKAQFLYDGKPLVSTFSGEVAGTFLDNDPDYNAAWQALKDQIGFPIYFLPAWTGIEPQTVPSVDGLFSWDAWSPVSSSPHKTNLQKLKAVGKQYAAPISAMFYKHLSAGDYGNWIHPTESWFVVEQYMDLISYLPDFVEIISWNDYGESHYLRDPRPSANLPVDVISSKKYVDGMPHEPLLDMLTFFNNWYKSGSKPTISSSTAYMWYRPHPKDAKPTSDPLGYPKFAEKSEDRLYIVLIVATATPINEVKIQSGEKSYSSFVKDLRASVGEDNILKISAPFSVGPQTLELFDSNGALLGRLSGKSIESQPEIYNFNYWSGKLAL